MGGRRSRGEQVPSARHDTPRRQPIPQGLSPHTPPPSLLLILQTRCRSQSGCSGGAAVLPPAPAARPGEGAPRLPPIPAAQPRGGAAAPPPAPAARPGEGAPRLPPIPAAQPRGGAAAPPPAPAARPGEGARGRNVRPGASLVVPAGAARCLPQAGDGFLARRLAARLVARRPQHHGRPLAKLSQCSAKPDPNPDPNPRKTSVSLGRPHAGASHFWKGDPGPPSKSVMRPRGAFPKTWRFFRGFGSGFGSGLALHWL